MGEPALAISDLGRATEALFDRAFSAGPDARLKECQTGSPHDLAVIGVIPAVRGFLESRLHKHFVHLRIRGEWYRLDDELRAFIAERTIGWPLAAPTLGYVAAVQLFPDGRCVCANDEFAEIARAAGEKNVSVGRIAA